MLISKHDLLTKQDGELVLAIFLAHLSTLLLQSTTQKLSRMSFKKKFANFHLFVLFLFIKLNFQLFLFSNHAQVIKNPKSINHRNNYLQLYLLGFLKYHRCEDFARLVHHLWFQNFAQILNHLYLQTNVRISSDKYCSVLVYKFKLL